MEPALRDGQCSPAVRRRPPSVDCWLSSTADTVFQPLGYVFHSRFPPSYLLVVSGSRGKDTVQPPPPPPAKKRGGGEKDRKFAILLPMFCHKRKVLASVKMKSRRKKRKIKREVMCNENAAG